ncbi:MAG: universal stress protein [Bacteroidia bacterium]
MKFLVTTDYSENSKAGVKFALQAYKQIGIEIHFFHCIEVLKPTSWSKQKYKSYLKYEFQKHSEQLNEFLKPLLKEIKISDLKFNLTIASGLEVDQLAIREAKKQKVDFICMSTRGAGGLTKLFGTHASQMINDSTVPVIVVPTNYKPIALKKIWYSTDLEDFKWEYKKLQSTLKTFPVNIEIHHYNYLAKDKGTKSRFEKMTSSMAGTKTIAKLHELKLDFPLVEYMEKDIKKDKPSLVVLFTKKNRNWFSRLFLGSRSEEMSFASHTPLLVFRKRKK